MPYSEFDWIKEINKCVYTIRRKERCKKTKCEEGKNSTYTVLWYMYIQRNWACYYALISTKMKRKQQQKSEEKNRRCLLSSIVCLCVWSMYSGMSVFVRSRHTKLHYIIIFKIKCNKHWRPNTARDSKPKQIKVNNNNRETKTTDKPT